MVCSKDLKKAIAFGLILGAILSICNLCFASDNEVVTVQGLLIGSNGTFVNNTSSGGGIKYVELHKGDVVTCSITNGGFFVCTSDVEPSKRCFL